MFHKVKETVTTADFLLSELNLLKKKIHREKHKSVFITQLFAQ